MNNGENIEYLKGSSINYSMAAGSTVDLVQNSNFKPPVLGVRW